MTIYKVALFLHVAGALGIIVPFTIEAVALAQLRRARDVEQVREWGRVMATMRAIGPVSLILLLVPGIYMAATNWAGARWPWIGLIAMALLPALGAPSGIRLARIQRALAAESGPLGAAVQQELRDPFLQLSVRVRVAVLLGIVYLMTTKPDVAGAATAIAAAAAMGVVWSLPGLRAQQAAPGDPASA
jgi:hypothetical protein